MPVTAAMAAPRGALERIGAAVFVSSLQVGGDRPVRRHALRRRPVARLLGVIHLKDIIKGGIRERAECVAWESAR